MTEGQLKNRLRLQCRRGMLELDIFFGRYLDTQYDAASAVDRENFTRLLEENDQDLFVWLTGRAKPITPALADIVDKIRAHALP